MPAPTRSLLITPLLLSLLRARAEAAEPWYKGIDGIKLLRPDDMQQKELDGIYDVQRQSQFGEKRYAVLLTPGKYEGLNIKVSYYTSVIGVGSLPGSVELDGITSENGLDGHATNNFWRSVEGVKLTDADVLWAVSQASPMRRTLISGDIHLSDRDGFSSGGFLADVHIQGRLYPGSQQQWFFRNAEIAGGIECPAGWNYVFVGATGLDRKSLQACGGKVPGKVTHIHSAPRIAEKPFLVLEDDGFTWSIYVPAFVSKPSRGPVVHHTGSIARKLDLDMDVFVARPGHAAKDINEGMLGRKGLLVTPGIYNLSGPIVIREHGVVVLGLGFPTLIASNGLPALEVVDGLEDVRVAGLLFEAGTPTRADPTLPLLLWGTHWSRKPSAKKHNASGVVSDVFARIGSFEYKGCKVVRADVLMEINSDDVVLDNVWLWHADHDDCGTEPTRGQIGNSDKCYSTHGLVVNGHRVTSYGLAVEHVVGGDNVLWNGEDGDTYFYQCELPYHQPHFNAHGYAVSDKVTSHFAAGLGVYIINRALKVESAFALPPNAEATNLVSVVIAGHVDQFQDMVCAHWETNQRVLGEKNHTHKKCFPAQSCSGMRCFLPALPHMDVVTLTTTRRSSSTRGGALSTTLTVSTTTTRAPPAAAGSGPSHPSWWLSDAVSGHPALLALSILVALGAGLVTSNPAFFCKHITSALQAWPPWSSSGASSFDDGTQHHERPPDFVRLHAPRAGKGRRGSDLYGDSGLSGTLTVSDAL